MWVCSLARQRLAAGNGFFDASSSRRGSRKISKALDLFRRQQAEQSLDFAENLLNPGVLAMRRSDASHGGLIFRQRLATYRRLLPAVHLLIADAITNLARSLDREGKSGQAEPIYLDALAAQRHLFGDVHADVATTLNNLAVLYLDRSDYANARTMMQQVVDIWTKPAGPSHPLAPKRVPRPSGRRILASTWTAVAAT